MTAKIYQFPAEDKNGNYTEAYIEWQYEDYYKDEEFYYVPEQSPKKDEKKESFLRNLARKIFAC